MATFGPRMRALVTVTAVLCFAAIGAAATAPIRGHLAAPASLRKPSGEALGSLPHGYDLTAVVLGGSSCAASQMPGLKEAVQLVGAALRVEARKDSATSTLMGVAVDWSVDDGVRWLRKIGSFDEVAVGRNWTNLAAIRFIWSDSESRAAIPQLIIVRRAIDASKARITTGRDSILERIIGVPRITAWAHAHADSVRGLNFGTLPTDQSGGKGNE